MVMVTKLLSSVATKLGLPKHIGGLGPGASERPRMSSDDLGHTDKNLALLTRKAFASKLIYRKFTNGD